MLLRVGGAAVVVVMVAGQGLGLAWAVEGNPYQAIAARNSFGLVRPVALPAPVSPPAQANRELPRVRLAGLIDVGGVGRVLLEFTRAGASAPDRLVAKAGERVGGLRVVEVDLRTACAKVQVDGQEMLLTLASSAGTRKGG